MLIYGCGASAARPFLHAHPLLPLIYVRVSVHWLTRDPCRMDGGARAAPVPVALIQSSSHPSECSPIYQPQYLPHKLYVCILRLCYITVEDGLVTEEKNPFFFFLLILRDSPTQVG